ncbi:MAG TPA: DUF1587 domain-containing protein, partial [Bryobacteraceae bacterium]
MICNRNWPQWAVLAFVSIAPCCAADALAGPGGFISQYCLTCHNQKSKTGGVVLEGTDAAHPASRPELWEKVIRKIKAGEMPPAGLPRPEPAALNAFVIGLTNGLDAAAKEHPFAGRPVIRRLNRVEYGNAIRDLLAIDLPIAGELPPDGIAAGFDNIGDALSMSPVLLEQYLKVARKVSELAVGVADNSPVTETFLAPGDQAGWLEGLPFGTRGGEKLKYYFPADGEYGLRAFIGRDSLPHAEGVRFFQTRVPVTAGSHTVVVTFPDEFAAREGPVPNVAGKGGRALGGPLDTRGSAIHPTIEFRVDSHRVKLFDIGGISVGEAAFAGQPGPPTLDRVEISGPYDAKAGGETPSRRQVFVCHPARPEEETGCASQILSTLARRAFRRDVTAADVRPFLAAYSASRAKRNFDFAIGTALRDLLLAPDFLFRLEFDPADAQPGTAKEVSAWELATRVSFFLWSSIPDDALLDDARSGKLKGTEVLNRQVRRLLGDSRATAMADNFTSQWLGLRGLGDVKPDTKDY